MNWPNVFKAFGTTFAASTPIILASAMGINPVACFLVGTIAGSIIMQVCLYHWPVCR